MRKLYSIAALAILGLVFQACGQKGPLRLPDRAKPPVESPAPANSPVAPTTDNTVKEP